MAGAYVDIDTREVLSLSDKISGAKLSTQDRRKLLSELGVETEAQTQERFDTKVSPDGNKWKDIADSTKEYYARRFPSAQPPLVVSGSLRDTIESKVGSWDVLTGETKEYAAVHQYGFPKKNIAARPSLGLNMENETDLAAITEDFMKRKMG